MTIYTRLQTAGVRPFQIAQRKWEVEIPGLSEERWEEASEVCFLDLIGSNEQSVQFKFIHQLHYTPARLARMGYAPFASCFKCGSTNARYMHMFCSCPALSTFWKDLFSFFEDALHLPVPRTPEVGLLGVLNSFLHKTHTRTLARIVLFYARKLNLLQWKNLSAPNVQMLYCMINKIIPIFKLIYNGRACPKRLLRYGNLGLT